MIMKSSYLDGRPVESMRWRLFGFALAIIIACTTHANGQERYELGQGDKIRIIVVGHSDLSGEFIVGSEESVMFPVGGAISVKNRTIREFESTLATTLSQMLSDSVSVSAEVIERRPFFIVGDVRRPGAYPYQPGFLVVNALAVSSGIGTEGSADGLLLEAIRENTNLQVELSNLRRNLARHARLAAQRAGSNHAEASPELVGLAGKSIADQFMAEENRILEAELKLQDAQIAGYRGSGMISQEEIAAYERQIEQLSLQQELVQAELESMQKAEKEGLVARSLPYELRRSLGDLNSQKLRALASIADARQRFANSLRAIREIELQQDVSLQRQMADIENEISRQQQTSRGSLMVFGFSAGAHDSVETLLSPKFEIVRKQAEGYATYPADELTPIYAGDIVRVWLESDKGLSGLSSAVSAE
jgi:polysaccharide export outer membrane protein